MIQTAEDKVKEYRQCIRQEIEHWKDINQNGCSDPFWPDGCNMNLTRNHIIYYQSKIREICTENWLPLPDEYYLAAPPEVNVNYGEFETERAGYTNILRWVCTGKKEILLR